MSPATHQRKPRLLVLASTYPRWLGDHEPGFVHELSKRLTSRFDVTVITPHAAGAVKSEEMDGVRVNRFRYAPAGMETLVNDGGMVANLRKHPWKWLLVPGFGVANLWAAWRTVARMRPDVVHAHWLIPQGLIAALLRALDPRMPPYVVTSHGADLYALRAAPWRWVKRWVARRSSALTVVSSAMLVEMGRLGIEAGNISVQPMGVDLVRRFAPDPTVERSRDELLFVGRLVEKKGLRHLLDAMPTILHAHPSAYLTVVGFGPEETALRSQVTRLGLQHKVRFLGALEQAELPDLYRRAAMFVAPFVQAASGDQEGLGLVAVEAAGCGCPVVVSDLPQVRQAFRDEGSAYLVASGSVQEVTEACMRVLTDPRQAAAQAMQARETLVQQLDWSTRSAAYEGILRRLVP